MAVERAIVVASAHCGPSDFTRLVLDGYMRRPHVVIAVNEAFRWLRRFDHWVSLHPDKMEGWMQEAIALGIDVSRVTCWGPDVRETAYGFEQLKAQAWPPFVQRHWWDWHEGNSGSSGLFGVGVAFSLGCHRVLLAGVPLDTGGHVGSNRPWADRHTFAGAWYASRAKLQERVRSPSGYTRELLGEPTLHWWDQ